MFSGIVEGLERPIKLIKKEKSIILSLPIPKGWQINLGDSISIDGICATAQGKTADTFTVFFMDETLKKTSLTSLSSDHRYNLERPLRLDSILGGHMVSGHVDTTGEILKMEDIGEARIVTIGISKQFSKYLVYKGSVTVNGVSLTVVVSKPTEFTVSLIPYTLKHTNLGPLTTGEKVNIEVDMMAKYIEQFVSPYLKK